MCRYIYIYLHMYVWMLMSRVYLRWLHMLNSTYLSWEESRPCYRNNVSIPSCAVRQPPHLRSLTGKFVAEQCKEHIS